MKHHHHHHRHHNRPGTDAQRLAPAQAKAQHRKHGKTFEYDSECLLEAKAYKKGGASITFTDGSTYFYPELDKSDLAGLDGTAFNKEIR